MRYFYLRDEHNNPVACVASTKDEDGFIYFAVSTRNPKDKFDREIARQVAEGRLQYVDVGIKLVPKIKELIVRQIANDTSMPTRTRNAAALWLKYNQQIEGVL